MNVESEQYHLIESSEENKNLICNKDKYDYLAAVACGAVGRMIDIFLVGAPGDSKLVKWTDEQVDNSVKAFARKMGWNPREGQQDSVASAIGSLERKFKVNYDQRHSADVGNLFDMAAKNHHMKSLSYSPDIVGLYFSILNQFTSTLSFIGNGKVITIKSDTYELQGNNFMSKLFCEVANWFGHIMSDIAGSSGSSGNSGRGTGVVIPFYELFGFCKFGKFNVGKDKQDLATIATRAFQEGYDFRFVTLVLKEVCIRVGILDPLQINIDAYRRINEALMLYLQQLEKIDIDLFKKETAEYIKVMKKDEYYRLNMDECNKLKKVSD